MKTCSRCKIEKSSSEFFRKCDTKDGFSLRCKSCQAEWQKSSAGKQSHLKYERSNKGKKNRDKYRYSFKGRLAELKARIKYEFSPKGKLVRQQYRSSESTKLKLKKWSQNYNKTEWGRSIRNANSALRYASKTKATPKWLTKEHRELIKMYYQRAAYMTTVTGLPHVVDHIIPLRGTNIVGLHVPWNLRVIPERENILKGNRI